MLRYSFLLEEIGKLLDVWGDVDRFFAASSKTDWYVSAGSGWNGLLERFQKQLAG